MIHETGHLLGAGRNDDRSIAGVVPQEVYSGKNDETPEDITIGNLGNTSTWSVMSGGYQQEFGSTPMNGDYISFSIEELLTIEFKEIETRSQP